VKSRVDERMVHEARHFAFRFACEDCVHFDPAEARCSLGFIAAPRRATLDAAPSELELCKTFELS
jgi:hypothetical protein